MGGVDVRCSIVDVLVEVLNVVVCSEAGPLNLSSLILHRDIVRFGHVLLGTCYAHGMSAAGLVAPHGRRRYHQHAGMAFLLTDIDLFLSGAVSLCAMACAVWEARLGNHLS